MPGRWGVPSFLDTRSTQVSGTPFPRLRVIYPRIYEPKNKNKCSEEVCVLSASGTAAIVKLQPNDPDSKGENSRADVIISKKAFTSGRVLPLV